MDESHDRVDAMSASVAPMSRQERDDLGKLVRQRERLAKAVAAQRAAELLADFEAKLAAEYAFDQDDVWREATRIAQEALGTANEAIAARCAELGIPKAFAPRLSMGWLDRGENATAGRRAELRKVAQSRIAAMEKDARVRIGAASLAVQTGLLADGLTSEAAHRFLEAMPTPEALMPPLALAEVTTALPNRFRITEGP